MNPSLIDAARDGNETSLRALLDAGEDVNVNVMRTPRGAHTSNKTFCQS